MSPVTLVQQPPRLGRGARFAITAGVAAVCWLGGLVLLVAALIAEITGTDAGEEPASRLTQPWFIAAGLVFAVGVAAIIAGVVSGMRTPRAGRPRPTTDDWPDDQLDERPDERPEDGESTPVDAATEPDVAPEPAIDIDAGTAKDPAKD